MAMVHLRLLHLRLQLRRLDNGDCIDVSYYFPFGHVVVVAVVCAVEAAVDLNEGVTFQCIRQINYRHCRHHRHD